MLPYLLNLIAVASLAGFDEWYQSFVPGRSSDFRDFLADLAGGLLAIGIFILWSRWRTSRRS
jgi:VanZ family protein